MDLWPFIEAVITKMEKIKNYLKNRHQENFYPTFDISF